MFPQVCLWEQIGEPDFRQRFNLQALDAVEEVWIQNFSNHTVEGFAAELAAGNRCNLEVFKNLKKIWIVNENRVRGFEEVTRPYEERDEIALWTYIEGLMEKGHEVNMPEIVTTGPL